MAGNPTTIGNFDRVTLQTHVKRSQTIDAVEILSSTGQQPDPVLPFRTVLQGKAVRAAPKILRLALIDKQVAFYDELVVVVKRSHVVDLPLSGAPEIEIGEARPEYKVFPRSQLPVPFQIGPDPGKKDRLIRSLRRAAHTLDGVERRRPVEVGDE